MRVLDEAVFAALDAADSLTGRVYYGSPLRDTKPEFVSYYPIASKPWTGQAFQTEGRQYLYELIAAHPDGLQAEALIESAEAALEGQKIPVAGWGLSQTITWAGDIHDLGDLVADGTVIHFAGRVMQVIIQKPR